MVLLSVQNISAIIDGKNTVNNISFEQHSHQKIAIAGETGSGKTTLLKMIGGLLQPASGEIFLNGEKVKGPDEQLIPGHPKIGYLSQHFELRNNYRVEELLDMHNLVSPEKARRIYEVCDITHLTKRWTDQLSGGERQRIALAKILTTAPSLLLLDEPYSNLDLLHKRAIKNAITKLGEEMGISCILVSHDAADILSWADTVFFMKDGQIIQSGTAPHLYNHPINEYCAALLGPYNLLSPGIQGLTHLEVGGKKLFFRPENIRISDTGNGIIGGTIEKILYWGSYYTIDVKVGKDLVTVQSSEISVSLGEQVMLDILKEPHWIN